MSLAKQFTVISLFVISIGMIGLGSWIGLQIRNGVIQHTAATTTLYMESFVEPLAQGLATATTFDAQTSRALDGLLDGPLKGNLIVLKIWNLDGSIAYSNNTELIGKKFEIEESLANALKGIMTAELDETETEENSSERQMNIPLLEVYSPLYQYKTGKLIGVGEFYLRADELLSDLSKQTFYTWAVVAMFTLFMVLILSAIMLKASNTINRQRIQLDEQVKDLTKLLGVNTELSSKIKMANMNAAALNDLMLNRLGSDLHDGPAQQLAFALLRLSSLTASNKEGSKQELDRLQQAIRDALKEIRHISAGLNLPQLAELPVTDVIRLVVGNHERMTETKVNLKLQKLPKTLSLATKTCLYRFVQEGLTNAFKHAKGVSQSVSIDQIDDTIVAEVGDKGKGFVWKGYERGSGHLGLIGMQNCVQAFGGTMSVVSAPGRGCTLTARIPIDGEGVRNEQQVAFDRY